MNRELLQSINREVYRRFPEMKGVRPKMQSRSSPKALPEGQDKTFVLVYQMLAAPPEVPISRTVRVVVSGEGKILKISTSR